MKRSLFFCSIFLIFLVSSSLVIALGEIPADACSNKPDQLILKLSSNTNAHAEKYNQGNYNVQICYDSIFGKTYTYSQGENPRACSGTNSILNLSADTNAHAKTRNFAGEYNTEICYGDLFCRTVNLNDPGAIECGENNPDEEEILKLSAGTNAHLAVAGSSGYNYQICCIATPQGELSEAHWEDYAGNSITQSCRGDIVRMVASGNFGEEQFNINYEVKKSGNVIATSTAVNQGASAISDFEISAQIQERDELTFTAILGASSVTSSALRIKEDINCRNTRPRAEILSPIEGIYFIGEELNFEHGSYDIEGPVRVVWKIDDPDFDNVLGNTEQDSFVHSYSEPGLKAIMLNVFDTDNLLSRDRVVILVLGSPGAYANIAHPDFEENVFGKLVSYTGEGSYVVDFDLATYSVQCLAGDCPAATIGCPCPAGGNELIDCSGFTGTCPLPVSDYNVKTFSGTEFTWSFLGENNAEVRDSRTAQGEAGKTGQVAYTAYGLNKIKLLFRGFTTSSQITNEFNIFRENGCSFDGETYYDEGVGPLDTRIIPEACGLPSYGICCPTTGGYNCVDDPNDNIDGRVCVQNTCVEYYDNDLNQNSEIDSGETFPVENCNDYNKIDASASEIAEFCRTDCAQVWTNPDQENIAKQIIGGNIVIKEEACIWEIDSSRRNGGICTYSYDERCTGPNCDPEPPENNRKYALRVVSEDECLPGQRVKTITYVRDVINRNTGELIEAGVQEFSNQSACPKTIKLGFFGFFSFVLTALLIVIIYTILISRKK